MKLLFASDIHGSASAIKALALRVEAENPDRIIVLGDLLYHGPRNNLPDSYDTKEVARLLNSWSERLVAVRGNCDAEVDQMVLTFPCMSDYALLEAEGHLFYLTHGHVCGMTPDNLPPLPPHSVYCSGHTHIKRLETTADTTLLNPGSVSLPKDDCASYALFDNGTLALKDLRGTTLQSMLLA